MTARPDEGLLVAVIDEVIYRLDADVDIPVWVRARPAADGGITVSFAPVPVAAAEIAGAAPKAASLSELRCAPRCGRRAMTCCSSCRRGCGPVTVRAV